MDVNVMKEMNPVLLLARVYRRPMKMVSGLNIGFYAPVSAKMLRKRLFLLIALALPTDAVKAQGMVS